ncbi:LysR family transcriptional regulator [Rhodovibrionaceae bacterium A322]
MLNTEDLRFFAKLATAGSLADLARQLDVTPPAITQRLKQIETKAGVRLVDRTARRLALTHEGELIVVRAHEILNALDDLTDDLTIRRDAVAGHLRVRAPLTFGRCYVAPVVAEFQEIYPETQVDLFLSDRPNITTDERVDVILHIGDLPNSSLRMRRLASNKRILCASPAYLSRAGEPQTVAELRRHSCIALRENNEDVTLWRFSHNGRTTHIRINPKLSCNDGEVARNWALEGRGIVLRSEWDVAQPILDGRLKRILPNYSLPDADVVALLNHQQGRAARVDRFLELMAGTLSPPPWNSGLR